MREFKRLFEKLGYTFQSEDVLEDIYLFYKYYNNPANKGVSSILLEGDPGSGKTFLSEIFSLYLGSDTEYIYTQCVEETNSDRLIATYNVPAIVKGDADSSIAAGVLTRAIEAANEGKKVVLTIDELDKAREVLDSYFLDFLQSGKIETSNNEILSLTEDGRKNLYVILAKNNERDLLEALLRRCSVIKLPPMPPVLAYKTLLSRLEDVPHDPKFLKFVCKVYEAIYNEQMNSNQEFFSRLPALQELITAITSDYELYENSISSTRRIKNLIRKLGKEEKTREDITRVLIKKFKYQNQESNYTDEKLDIDIDNPDEYMSKKGKDDLVEQYMESKDNGEYIFEEETKNDPMSDIADFLDNMKDDQALVFLDDEYKEKIVELGVINHKDPKALDILFQKIKFKGNPHSRFGFLDFEGDNYIGLVKIKNTLVLIANKEYVSPRLLMRGLSVIVNIIYDYKQNVNFNQYFSEIDAKNFQLTGLNAKILSHVPELALDKMKLQKDVYIYQSANLKVKYDDNHNVQYFEYLQKYRAEPLYDTIESICKFNPELAIPTSFMNAKKFEKYEDRKLLRRYSQFEFEKEQWEQLKLDRWEVKIDEFRPMNLTFVNVGGESYYDIPQFNTDEDKFVFEWKIDKDNVNKKLHVYPKYYLKGEYLLYTCDEDFKNDDSIRYLNPFQKEIAFMAKNIFGNFIPQYYADMNPDYFSYDTMSKIGKIVDDESIRKRIRGIDNDIIVEPDFINYYDSLAQPSVNITQSKSLRKDMK